MKAAFPLTVAALALVLGPAAARAQARAPAAAATAAPATAPSGAPAPAAPTDPAKARFSEAPVYTGAPNLAVTLSLVTAGGGPNAFSSSKLLETLAGDKTQAEVAALRDRFGPDAVKSFLNVFTFVVNDALKYVAAAQIPLPATPSPDPKDGKALSEALYKLGVLPTGRFDVEYMLDGLVSHTIHLKVMDDIDAKYGTTADANYHAVLATAMNDLKTLYGF